MKGFSKHKDTLWSLLHFSNATPGLPKHYLDISKFTVENRKLRKDLCSLSDHGRLSVFQANSINPKENCELNISKPRMGRKRNLKTQEFGVAGKGVYRNLLKGKIQTMKTDWGLMGVQGGDFKN